MLAGNQLSPTAAVPQSCDWRRRHKGRAGRPRHTHMGSLSSPWWLRRRSPGTGGSGATRYMERCPRRGNAWRASAPLTYSVSLPARDAGRGTGERDVVSCTQPTARQERGCACGSTSMPGCLGAPAAVGLACRPWRALCTKRSLLPPAVLARGVEQGCPLLRACRIEEAYGP